MINLAQFSGGKDSTAMLLWLKEQGIEFTAVFCDTGWEHPLTYAYIEEINQTVLNGKLVTVRSAKYSGFEDLSIKKGRMPSATMRFCTQELKLFPFWNYLDTLDDEVTAFIGIRADESEARSHDLPREWSDKGYWIERPLLGWSANDVFEIAARHCIAPNPLYLLGASRVGCFPCVLINHRELRTLLRTMPEIRDRIRSLEEIVGRSFFYPKFIPSRFHTSHDPKSDKSFPTCDDVFRYLESVDENQLPLFEAPKCMSIYNLCE